MKWMINDVDVLQPSGSSSIDIPAVSGQEFVRTVSLVAGRVNETRCNPSLPNDAKRSPIWDAATKSGLKSTEGMIAFECKLSINGNVFSTPAIIVGDGKPGVIEAVDRGSQARFRVVLKATTTR